MKPADIPTLERIDREIGIRGRFYDFVRLAWSLVDPHPYVDGWHIGLICEVLEAVYRGEIRKAGINIPPGFLKSLLVSVFWPVWCWIKDARLGFLGTSFDMDLTRRDAGKSLGLIQNEWFRHRWGDLVWVDDGAGAAKYQNARGGWRFSTSVGSKATGRHPDIVIIDDPTKPLDVSPGTLQAAEDYWNNTLRSRQRDPKTVRRVLIMQRLAVNDLAGVFEREGDWHFVVLPMRYAPAYAYPKDPRRVEGELLQPERVGEPEVRELERMPARDRAAQLQQRPVPEGGAIIKSEWIQWYDPTPDRKYPELPAAPPRFNFKIHSWDLTFKDTESAHFVAGQTWGMVGPDFYLLPGAVLERLDFVGSLAAIGKMNEAHPGCGTLIEDKANGPAVLSMLGSKIPGMIPVTPQGGKDARLNAASVLFEAKNVWLPKGDPVAEQLAISLVTFPVGAWDDDVDACTQALNYMHEGIVDYAAAMKGLKDGRF